MTSLVQQTHRDLSALFEPDSLVIVGASNDPGKWGHWVAEGALRGAKRRDVYLVNRRGDEILGNRSFSSARELPGDVELGVIAVPLGGFEQAIDDVLAAGAKAIVVVNAGFAEMGQSGLARQERLTERIRAAGAALVGPNCLGVVDTTSELEAAWLQLGPDGLTPGPVGLISQSGTVALDIATLARDAGIGISRFVSLGNQADVTLTDLVWSYVEHPGTEVVALYCEDFRDGREFLNATRKACEAGKPVVLLAAGASEAASRAARSHTGALTTDARVVEAACRATGAIKVDTPAEMVDVMQLLVRAPRPAGCRVAVVSDGGGHGVVTVDTVNRLGLETSAFSPALQARLREVLDESSAIGNPVDLARANVDPNAFQRAVEVLTASDEVDAVMLTGYFGGWGDYDEALSASEAEAGRAIAKCAQNSGVPVVVQTMVPGSAPALAARAAGVPLYRTPEAAARALSRVASAREALGVPALSDSEAPGPPPLDGDYFGIRALLSDAGLNFPPAREVSDSAAAVAAADEIGYPVAIKAVTLLHKSDLGGVALGLSDREAVRQSVETMIERLDCDRFSVEAMVDTGDGIELVVGVQRDPRFGPVLAVGLGGTFTEIFDDVVVALAPIEPDQLEALLGDLRGHELLEGARGRPPVDLRAAATAGAALSRVAARRPDLAELEVNPLLVSPRGALALDARAVQTTSEGDTT